MKTLNGQETAAGEYPEKIVPSAAAIGDATDNYEITYVAGKLTIEKGNDDTPGMGDNTMIKTWFALMLISAVGMALMLCLLLTRTRRKEQ
ncbi:MAG: hypothetical protein CW338_12340 [Clostridiales bacterium]|nr:hypothetical protein [Clostridiales bacterium]